MLGKTTILKDIIWQLSNGIPKYNFTGKNIAVVDERGELASMYKGIPQNDLGLRTDVLENLPKSQGMKMLIRSMNPEILCTDEIGTKEDAEAIEYAVCCGIKLIFTAHGSCMEDLNNNIYINCLVNKKLFHKIIFIEKNNLPRTSKRYYNLVKS